MPSLADMEGFVVSRHNNLRDTIANFCRPATFQCNCKWLSSNHSNSRPADILVQGWERGLPAVLPPPAPLWYLPQLSYGTSPSSPMWYLPLLPYGTSSCSPMVPPPAPLWYLLLLPYGTSPCSPMVPPPAPLWYLPLLPYGTSSCSPMVPPPAPLWYLPLLPYGTSPCSPMVPPPAPLCRAGFRQLWALGNYTWWGPPKNCLTHHTCTCTCILK